GGSPQGGPSQGGGRSPSISRNQLSIGQNRPRSISSLYDLVTGQVSIPGSTPQAPATVIPSPLRDRAAQEQYLPMVLDRLTTQRSTEIPARVNVNTAPAAVLTALPGLEEADVQQILALRPQPSSAEWSDPVFQTPAWLMVRANFSGDKMRAL